MREWAGCVITQARSRDQFTPIRGHFSGHVISLDQSEAIIEDSGSEIRDESTQAAETICNNPGLINANDEVNLSSGVPALPSSLIF